MRLAPPERAPQVILSVATLAQFVILLPVLSLGASAPLLLATPST